MERKITETLCKWKDKPGRKPLIVRGARQTGKSYTITEFGHDYFEGSTHIVNFEKRTDWKPVFEKNYDIERILKELEILLGQKIVPGRDLLFLDEIQECPKAILALRYFLEQAPGLHVIAAGSLLEFSLGDIPFPFGRVHLMDMFPMNFAEFLVASGNRPAAELIGNPPEESSPAVHEMLRQELRTYFFTGGMPECVKAYVSTKSLQEVFEVQSDLMSTFRQDFLKYSPKADPDCLNAVLSSVPQRIGQQIKYAGLAEGFTNPTIKKAFGLLETARLFKRVRAASPAGIPLGASASDKKFKAIMLDIGLLGHLTGISRSQEYQTNDLLSVYRGAMAEQFAGQEILANTGADLYYWAREAKSSNAETDYLIEKQGKIIPVEIKSGKGGSLRSLHLLLESYPNLENACVFSDSPYRKSTGEKITFLPLYYIGSVVV